MAARADEPRPARPGGTGGSTPLTRRYAAAVALGTLALAAALRVIGLGFGLPAVYNPDEIAILNRALALPQNGFNPGNFVYPSLYFYVLLAVEAAWFGVGWLVGVFGSLADFERAYFVDPSSLYLAGRVLSVAAGVTTVWLTGRLGTALFGYRAGAAAALVLAVAPLAVRDAHYVKHDVPVTLLIVLAHWCVVRATERPNSTGAWVATGAVSGLAASTHYYAVFALVPALLLAAARWRPDGSRRAAMLLAAVIGAAAAAFIATSPFLLIDVGTAIRDMSANRAIVVDRATEQSGLFSSLVYYVGWLSKDAIGPIAALAAAAGIGVALRSGRAAVILLGFPVTFLLFLANTVPASRYLNAVLPFAAVLAGAAVAALLSRGAVARVAGVAVLVIACVGSGLTSLSVDRFFQQVDTRTLALSWIEREVPEGTSILVQPYSVPVRMSQAGLREALTHTQGDVARASVRFQRQLAVSPYPTPSYRVLYLGSGGLDADKIYLDPAVFDARSGLAALRDAAVSYVVLKRYNAPDPSMVSIAQALEREGRLVASFSPYAPTAGDEDRRHTPPFLHNTDVRIGPALERPGPIVEIWRVP